MYNIYVYMFSPSLRDNFCNTKFVYDFVVFSFECHLRDRPFNLQGGGLWFFVSFRNVFSDNTKWHSKENTTKSYTNFVLQKLFLKDGGNHIYIYIVHSTCNIVTIRFKGREGGLKNPYKISSPTKFVNNVCVTQKRPLAVFTHNWLQCTLKLTIAIRNLQQYTNRVAWLEHRHMQFVARV
jgi:hypothetical protein